MTVEKRGISVIVVTQASICHWLRVPNRQGNYQCCAINVGFELHIVIESKLSISNIGFDYEMGKFGHFDFDIDIISIKYQYQ